MKFHLMPQQWPSVVQHLEENGFEQASLEEADFLVFNGTPADFPQLGENIKWVQLCLAGIDGFFDAGIITDDRRWANAGGIYGRTVAESAVALLLSQLHCHVLVARKQTWDTKEEVDQRTAWLYDKTVAILGAGGIGRDLIPMLKGFGCRILAVNNSGRPVEGADETRASAEAGSIYSDADYFILAAPLTPETHHMINAETLAQMRPHAVVVNVGRGPLVDTDALVAAVQDGTIAGAALDVTEPEPLPDGHPLWSLDQVVITPHEANTQERIRALIAPAIVANAKAFIEGSEMPTEVFPEKGY
ncbi:D-isomer specific 2-hydroxyacid dehydrogenase family protein [Corynebacterium epidermidicanis]|uniref:Phosphoglycerate dehydrogenase-like oxidoreductase n=1 Tax=Corynebacterium epidermidicanis TaxID=1050174 RepID=A0A0G3GRM5_9CORY|nr:D-isomer specific 2-hydroxyacid dehydrogenase family protein [Corynebacterium epidermidicanis]AKK03774.1 phosphoglycerate dehydrogenase-like oxidoreductase [Corynebacterium epidermidicanis]